MDQEQITLRGDDISGRGCTLSAFTVIENAAGFISFAEEVFDAEEVEEARTRTPSGKLIHAEVRIGDSLLLLAEPQEGWPTRPGMFQVWVRNVEALITRAINRGAAIVTAPTPFYGSLTLARIEDSWGNLWWLFQPVPGQPDPKPVWEGGSDIVFRTIDEYMRSTNRRSDPFRP